MKSKINFKNAFRLLMGLAVVALCIVGFDVQAAHETTQFVAYTPHVQTMGGAGFGVLMAGSLFEKGLNALTELVSNEAAATDAGLSQDLIAAVRSGKNAYVVNEHTYYHNVQLSTDNTSLIKSSDIETFAYRNFNNGMLPKDTAFVLLGIAFRYGVSTASNTVKLSTIEKSSFIYDIITQNAAGSADMNTTETGQQYAPVGVQRIPNILTSSEVNLLVGNRPIITKRPMRNFLFDNLNGAAVDPTGIVPLMVPKVIPGATLLSLGLKPSDDATAYNSSYTHAFEVLFYGISVSKKS